MSEELFPVQGSEKSKPQPDPKMFPVAGEDKSKPKREPTLFPLPKGEENTNAARVERLAGA